MVNSIEIEYLEPKNEFRVGSVKNIAVPSNNVNDIKTSFPGSKKTESNADMLSQSFGSMPEISPIPAQVTTEPVQDSVVTVQNENVAPAVEISPIPVAQNSNLETEPVNLNTGFVMPEIATIEPVTVPVQEPALNVEPIVSEVKTEEVKANDEVVNVVPESTQVPFESGFKVSDAPNIFDNPVVENQVEENNVVETPNIFNQVKEEKVVEEQITQTDINDDIIAAEIAILENDIKYYEGLADNNRKKIELLKKKQIKKEDKEVNLENTASNLFNNNGVLDDEQVLGKTPMPNLRAA